MRLSGKTRPWRQALLVACALLAPYGQALAQEETLESVEAKIAERWEALSAYSATMHLITDLRHKGIRLRTSMSGPLVLERLDNGAARYRGEIEGTARIGPFGLLNIDARMLMVSDGDTLYSESHVMNQVTVTVSDSRQKSDAPGGGAKRFETAAEEYRLRLLPDTVFEGRPVYVIEGIPKPETAEKLPQMERVLIYFDKETGIQLNMALLDSQNNPITELRFSDIRVNPSVHPDAFEYFVPEGAQVDDRRRGSRQADS